MHTDSNTWTIDSSDSTCSEDDIGTGDQCIQHLRLGVFRQELIKQCQPLSAYSSDKGIIGMKSKVFVQQQSNQKKVSFIGSSDELREKIKEMAEKQQSKRKFEIGMALGEAQPTDDRVDEEFITLDPTDESVLSFSQQPQDEPRTKISSSERSEKSTQHPIQIRALLARTYSSRHSLLHHGFTVEMENCMFNHISMNKEALSHLIHSETAIPLVEKDLTHFMAPFYTVRVRDRMKGRKPEKGKYKPINDDIVKPPKLIEWAVVNDKNIAENTENQQVSWQHRMVNTLGQIASSKASSSQQHTNDKSVNPKNDVMVFNFSRLVDDKQRRRSVRVDRRDNDVKVLKLYDVMKQCGGGIFKKSQDGNEFVLQLQVSGQESYFTQQDAKSTTLSTILSLPGALDGKYAFNFIVTEESVEEDGNDL